MVSINSDWWDWDGEEPPQSFIFVSERTNKRKQQQKQRYKGRIVKWHSKDQGSESNLSSLGNLA